MSYFDDELLELIEEHLNDETRPKIIDSLKAAAMELANDQPEAGNHPGGSAPVGETETRGDAEETAA